MTEPTPDVRLLLRTLGGLLGPARPDRPSTRWSGGTLCGFERRTDPAGYRWHGLRRGADPARPTALVQYTLAGRGEHAHGGGPARPLTTGDGFVAVLPSAHEYGLPSDAGPDGWTFVWFVTSHPYVVARLGERVATTGPTFHAGPASAVVGRTVGLVDAVARGTFADGTAHEQALFAVLFELDRHADRAARDPSAREALLADVRRRAAADLARPPSVADLARGHGMSRTRFSHHFAAVTGLSPAKVVADVRLAHVADRLAATDLPLATLAAEAGFADANHLCKAFRRRHHVSPGQFRRQVR